MASYWEPYGNRTILDHTIYPVDITVNWDYAYDYGYYSIQGKRDTTTLPVYNGKYLIVWKKVAGNWKIHLDMFNSFDGDIPVSLKQQYDQ